LRHTSAANDTTKKLEPYLASIDGTLKGLGPYLAQVTRTLERLEQRLVPVVQPMSIVAHTHVGSETEREQHPAPVLRPTPAVADGPGEQPSDVPNPNGHGPERVDWGVACESDRSPTPLTVNEQPSGPSVTESTIYREAGAQITPLGETFGAAGSDTQPGDVATPQGHGPEKFD